MALHDTSPDLPPDNSDFAFDNPPAETPNTPGNPAVPPLFLSPKEEREVEDGHTPPGLSNPFWR